MIRIEVTRVINGQNVITNRADFETQEQADLMIQNSVESKAFGQNPRWVSSNDPGFEFIDITGAIQTEVTTDPDTGQSITRYLLPADYVIHQIDVAAEYEKRAGLKFASESIDLGAEILILIHYMNDQKNLTEDQFAAFLSNQTYANIERLLRTGSLKTAKTLIQGLGRSFYSGPEILEVISIIDTFMQKWGK